MTSHPALLNFLRPRVLTSRKVVVTFLRVCGYFQLRVFFELYFFLVPLKHVLIRKPCKITSKLLWENYGHSIG